MVVMGQVDCGRAYRHHPLGVVLLLLNIEIGVHSHTLSLHVLGC